MIKKIKKERPTRPATLVLNQRGGDNQETNNPADDAKHSPELLRSPGTIGEPQITTTDASPLEPKSPFVGLPVVNLKLELVPSEQEPVPSDAKDQLDSQNMSIPSIPAEDTDQSPSPGPKELGQALFSGWNVNTFSKTIERLMLKTDFPEPDYLFTIEGNQDGNRHYLKVMSRPGCSKDVRTERLIRLDSLSTMPEFSHMAANSYQPLRPEAKEVVNLSDHQFSHIAFFVEENSVPLNTLYRYSALASLIKLQLLAIILIKLAGHPWAQITSGIIVELVYTYFLYQAYCKISRRDLYIQLAIQFLTVSYLVMKFISTTALIDESTKQYKLGMAMAANIAMICVITISYIMYGWIIYFWGILGAIWEKIRSLRAPSSSLPGQSN